MSNESDKPIVDPLLSGAGQADTSPGDGVIAHFDAIVSAIPGAALIVNVDGVVLTHNDALSDLLGYDEASLKGQSISMLLPEQTRSFHAELIRNFFGEFVRRSMGNGKALAARHNDGSELPIEIGLNPILLGSQKYVLAILVDTRKREAENRNLRAIINASPYGNILVNEQGEVELFSSQAEQIFGYLSHEIVGQPIEVLIPRRYHANHGQLRASYDRSKGKRAMGAGRDLTGLHKDGSEIPLEIALSPLQIDSGNKVLVAVSDITDRKKMELDLRHLNTSLEEFTYVASHDLKSPLRGISDLVTWIREDIGSEIPASVTRNLDRMSVRVSRLERIIDNLLAYARAGRRAENAQAVNLTDMVNGIVEIMAIPPGFNVSLDFKLNEIVSPVTPLETILRNLIANAVKHHDKSQGEIRIDAVADGDRCIIRVKDDGPGIPEHARERVFKLFQTMTAAERENSGVGLAVARRLVEAHGGAIWITAGDNERGTIFNIRWPRFARKDLQE